MKTQSFLILSMVVLLATSASVSAYSGGDGSPENPYLIATAEDMNEIGADSNDWNKHFLLVADINLADYTGTQFNIIGYFTGNYISPENKPFTGVFDGNRHTISNFTYEYDPPIWSDGVGIFCFVDGSNAEIKNLGIIAPCVFGGEYLEGVSALVGIIGSGRINNCYVKGGKIIGYSYIAGLAGANHGIISDSYVQDANVAGGRGIAGAIAGMNYGQIRNCWSNGFVQGNWRIGGLVGVNKGTISNCYSMASVMADDYAGGLVGENFAGNILNCYSIGEVSSDSSHVGGLIGSGWYSIAVSCFWDIETGGPDNGIGTPLLTAQMQTESTFTDAGWDFIEIWDIGENQTYPFLRVYPAGDINHDDIVNFYDLAIIASHWLEGPR